MEQIVRDIIAQLAITGVGAIATGLFWIAKSLGRAMWQAQKDLDAAHKKIRELEDLIKRK